MRYGVYSADAYSKLVAGGGWINNSSFNLSNYSYVAEGTKNTWKDSNNNDVGAYAFFMVSFDYSYNSGIAKAYISGQAKVDVKVETDVSVTTAAESGYAEAEMDLDGEARLTATFPN